MVMKSKAKASIPQHVCIVMDGNGRWAKNRKMPRAYGHRKGVENTRQAIEYFANAGVRHLTLFAFSSENWDRPQEEVSILMDLFLHSLEKYSAELHQNNIRIRFIGDREAFSNALNKQIQKSELLTEDNQLMTLNVAANYGGQWDILKAVKSIAKKLVNNKLNLEQVNQSELESGLSLSDSPDPDLFIRTGGEQRISNFLLWQLAYSELYFTEVLWPDFSKLEMQQALDTYAQRQRRYGKTTDQLKAKC